MRIVVRYILLVSARDWLLVSIYVLLCVSALAWSCEDAADVRVFPLQIDWFVCCCASGRIFFLSHRIRRHVAIEFGGNGNTIILRKIQFKCFFFFFVVVVVVEVSLSISFKWTSFENIYRKAIKIYFIQLFWYFLVFLSSSETSHNVTQYRWIHTVLFDFFFHHRVSVFHLVFVQFTIKKMVCAEFCCWWFINRPV